MELNDILEKLSLPQDLTRRGFLKAASAAAAPGILNDAWLSRNAASAATSAKRLARGT